MPESLRPILTPSGALFSLENPSPPALERYVKLINDLIEKDYLSNASETRVSGRVFRLQDGSVNLSRAL